MILMILSYVPIVPSIYLGLYSYHACIQTKFESAQEDRNQPASILGTVDAASLPVRAEDTRHPHSPYPIPERLSHLGFI